MADFASDHDLLIKLIATTEAGFTSLHSSVDEVKTTLREKANSEYVNTLKERLEKVEIKLESSNRKLYTICGGVAALEFLATLFVESLKH